MATKAAWGAGRPWGLAQEAGRAVAWLEAMRLPGAVSLLALLVASDGVPCEQLRPVATRDGVWQGAGPLCPVLAGAYISDSGGEAFASSLREVYSPLLLLPFASLACPGVQVAWSTTSIVANRVAASVEGSGLSDGIAGPCWCRRRQLRSRPCRLSLIHCERDRWTLPMKYGKPCQPSHIAPTYPPVNPRGSRAQVPA